MNIGNTHINAINIVINPENINQDNFLNVFYPLKPNEALYIDLPVSHSQIEQIAALYYCNGVDKQLYFSGQQVITAHGIAFSNISQELKYKLTKVKHRIPLQRTILKQSTLPELCNTNSPALSSQLIES